MSRASGTFIAVVDRTQAITPGQRGPGEIASSSQNTTLRDTRGITRNASMHSSPPVLQSETSLPQIGALVTRHGVAMFVLHVIEACTGHPKSWLDAHVMVMGKRSRN
jgi:hypothetical protein